MKIEKVTIPNSRGQKLAAVIHCPEQITENLAILCPGYLDSKDYDHLVSLADLLSKRGYTVVRFDPTGTGESEGSVAEYLTSQYLKDIKSVLDYMLSARKYNHVLLGGHSRGGMVSILYAARDPRISSVLAIMSSSIKTIKGKRYEQWEKTGFELSFRDVVSSEHKKEYRVPYAHVIDRHKFNVFEDVKKVHVPIVLIAGELDTLVLPEDVKEIFDLANEPKKFFVVKGVGHDYRRNSEHLKLVNKKIIETFFK